MSRFVDPWFLILLFALIPLWIYEKELKAKILFSNIENIKKVSSKNILNPRFILKIVRFIALSLLIVALARPQAGKIYSQVESDGVDIILALDTSGSMRAMDFVVDKKRVERLEVVKNVVTDFIKKRASDRLGMVVFGTEAFTQCPLTLDHGIVSEFLNKLSIGMAGDATAIGSAIGVATKRLKDLKAKSKVIILLTDGRSNSGNLPPLQAAEVAKSFDIKIYTIGVGTRGPAPFLVDGFFGSTFQYQNVDIDEDSLLKIAEMTGGKYYRATSTTELENIYTEIDKLEKTEVLIKQYAEYDELYIWFILAGLALILLEILLSNTVLRKLP